MLWRIGPCIVRLRPSQTQHTHWPASSSAALSAPQAVTPGAGQVSGLFYIQSVGDKANVGGVGSDVLGVAAINLEPGQDDRAAQHMLAVKTVFTVPARAMHQGHSDPVADRNASDICANRFDCARASMARNARQLRQGWSREITACASISPLHTPLTWI